MDAKPQRPSRSRTFRDENQVPVQLAAKSIHQRNKSSPALSSLAHAQATKPPLTRAAFADVSNTARPLQTIKDDSVLNHKPVPHVLKDKPLQDVTNANAAALQKPAQRPLSVSGLKGFFSNLSTAQLPSHAPKPQHSIESFAKPPQPTAANKPVTKKSTAVLRDPVVQSTDVDKAAKQDHLTRTEPHPETVEHTAAEGKEANSTAEKLAPSPKDTKIKLAEPAIPEEVFDPGLDGVPLPKEDPAPSALNQLYDYRSHDQLYEDALQDPVASYRADGVPARELHDRKSAKHDKLIQQLDTAGIVPQSYVDEAYLGPYYEEGYTTARSLKSRGECTTGSTTVLLAPQMTTEAERELVAARQYVLESAETTELEEDEAWDTSMVAEYGDEIFSYMRCLEERMRPNPRYMDNQTEVQWSMRSVLMDWLVQVHYRFSLLPETLFLCVNYIDRFLSCKVVSLGKLQLVGATAIFIAAKYEEINCPSIQEIVYMVDGGYNVDEILKAERFMLSMLHFELGFPGPMSFLRRISKADDYDLETRTLAKYFLEITIMDERFVGCIPSYTAAGAHCLARLMLRKGFWTLKHVHYSGYTFTQLRHLLRTMVQCCEHPRGHHSAIYDKYADKRFKRASHFVQSEMDKGFTLPLYDDQDHLGLGPSGSWDVIGAGCHQSLLQFS